MIGVTGVTGVRAQEGVDVGGQEPTALLAVLRPVLEPWVSATGRQDRGDQG